MKNDHKPEIRKEGLMAARTTKKKTATNNAKLYNLAPIGYFTLSKEAEIIDVNLFGAKLLGEEYPRLIHRPFSFYVSENKKANFNSFFTKLFNNSVNESDEVILTINEKLIFVHLTGIVTDNDEQCLLTVVDITRLKYAEKALNQSETYITEHKRVEDELKRNELLLNTTQQLTHVGGWEWDFEKQFMFWTKEMYNIHDLDQDNDLSGISDHLDLHLQCFLPEDCPKIREAFHRCMEQGEPFDLEFPFITLKKRQLWIRTMANPVFKDGKVAVLTGFIMDITERKLFEKELMEREINYSVLFDTVKQAIYIQNPDSTFINVNQGAVDMYGYEKEYFIGKTPEFLSDPEKNDLNKIAGLMNLAYKGQPQKFEFWGKKKNGDVFPKEIWTVKGRYYGQEVLISLAIDITERKRAEAEIHLINEELLRINAEKDKFFSIIAHDLRSPFSGFLGLTELLAEGWNEMSVEDFYDLVMMMKKSATNLFSLLGNLLDWSRMKRGLTTFVPTSILLNPKITECLVLTQDAAFKKEIAISFEIPEDLSVFADENMFESIMRNLVSNAVKFTPKGGCITVSAKPGTGNFVEISVRDTGIGMSKEMIGNLCRLDINTKRKGTEGEYSTGLGLIICRDLIEKHGGKMWIESEEGKGSTFRFLLPSN